MSYTPSVRSIHTFPVDAPAVHSIMAPPEVLSLDETESLYFNPVVSLNPERASDTGMKLVAMDGPIEVDAGYPQPQTHQ